MESEVKRKREDFGIQDTINKLEHKKNQELFQRYVKYRIANGAQLQPLGSLISSFRKIADSSRIPLSEFDSEEQIQDLLSQKDFNTSYYKTIIIRLFRWMGKGDLVKNIKTKKTPAEIKRQRKKIILKEEYVLEVLKACDNDQDRALFEIFADRPTRPKDIENLNTEDVDPDEYGPTLHFISKTESGKRAVRLQNSRAAFMQFWKNHLYRGQKEKPVFYNMNRSRYGQRLLYGGMKERLQNIVKRANIPEDIKPLITLYTFRRTTTTWKLSDPDYTPKEVMVMGGWSNIQMLDTYGKTTDRMVNLKQLVLEAKKDPELRDKLIKDSKKDGMLAKLLAKFNIYNGEQQDILGSRTCPRCQEENISNASHCNKCWLPLTKKGFDKIMEEQQELKEVKEILDKKPELKFVFQELKNLREEMEKLKKKGS